MLGLGSGCASSVHPVQQAGVTSSATVESPKPDKPPELSALAGMSSASELAKHVNDSRLEARWIVVTRLAELGGENSIAPLGQLAADRGVKIAARALAALSTDGSRTALNALQRALKSRDGLRARDALKPGTKSDFKELALRVSERGGGPALLALLAYIPDEPKAAWYRQKAVFDRLDELADPRAADALLAFIQRGPHPHYRFRAAAALGALGDLRAAPHLAWRLQQDALQLYSEQHDWEQLLRRDDREPVVAARLLGELARLNPSELQRIRQESEAALIDWLQRRPLPHAAGMAALAAMESEAGWNLIRAWAQPRVALPQPGAQPPMPDEFVIAQSALQTLGNYRDERAWSAFVQALQARPVHSDVSRESLLSGGMAIQGMSVAALGIGASAGLSAWGRERAFEPLLAYVHDPKQYEGAQERACEALPWVGGTKAGARILKAVERYRKNEQRDRFRRTCLLHGLAQRPQGAAARELLAFMDPTRWEEQTLAAKALGKLGFDDVLERELLSRVSERRGPVAASLALLLAAKTTSLKTALPLLEDSARVELRRVWGQSFETVFEADLNSGYLFRLMEMAEALAEFEVAGEKQSWVKLELSRQLGQLEYEQGPHTLTRVAARYRLLAMAKEAAPQARSAALALRYFGEEGGLMALDQPGLDHAYVHALLDDLRKTQPRDVGAE